ncbi:MAG: branched-chain amino acid ABC transporter permease [Proteobacteria bacterium]|nr:branched-chain amino acid ABC transporter permease [Pseudomonadota bacterium]
MTPGLRKDLALGALAVGLLAVVLFVALQIGAGGIVSLIARIGIFALAALALSFLVTQAGLVSLGQAAAVGLGAYVTLALAERGQSELLVQLPLAALAAAAFAGLTGLVVLRARGVAFIMLTLAFAQMAFFGVAALPAFGGDDGMALAARSTLLGVKVLRSEAGIAVAALLLLGLALAALTLVRHARLGLALRAAMDNERRAEASGINIPHVQLAAYVACAAIAALSGVLLANQADYVSPGYLNWHRSGELLVMVVLGGRRLAGAVLGAALVLVTEDLISHYTEYWKFWLGLLIVAVVLLRGRDLSSLFGRRA